MAASSVTCPRQAGSPTLLRSGLEFFGRLGSRVEQPSGLRAWRRQRRLADRFARCRSLLAVALPAASREPFPLPAAYCLLGASLLAHNLGRPARRLDRQRRRAIRDSPSCQQPYLVYGLRFAVLRAWSIAMIFAPPGRSRPGARSGRTRRRLPSVVAVQRKQVGSTAGSVSGPAAGEGRLGILGAVELPERRRAGGP